MGNVASWLEQYGYVILFAALFLEMLALPLPGEMMLSYTGLYVFEGKMSLLLSALTAGVGVTAGVTLSYWIGYKLGKPFVLKYGKRVHLGEAQLARTAAWFEKYGDKLLFIAYFIPGVRHITGYFCGVTRMPFRRYAIYAYSGGFFWVSVFILLGKLLGPKWEAYHHTVNRYMILFGIFATAASLFVYVYRKYRQQMAGFILEWLARGVRHFHSLGKVKFLVLAVFAAFVALFSLMIGLIQDYFAQDFYEFDEITTYLVHSVLGPEWTDAMHRIASLGVLAIYGTLIVMTLVWFIFRMKDWRLELAFMLWVVVFGEMLDELLRVLFHRKGPITGGYQLFNTFPSEETLTAVMICGFSAYLLIRHTSVLYGRVITFIAFAGISLIVGFTRIYLNFQYPSDVAAGYVFGGVWLTLNIILLEVFRKIQTSFVLRA